MLTNWHPAEPIRQQRHELARIIRRQERRELLIDALKGWGLFLGFAAAGYAAIRAVVWFAS